MFLADAATPAATPPQGSMLQFVPFILMFVVLYFVMIRPQSKKAKAHAEMLKTVRSGDRITTTSGIVGTVVAVKDKTISIRSADTKLEVLKSAVAEITERSGEAKPEES